jgi:hypothetical protein
MVPKEVAALVESYRMREDFAHCFELHAGGGDHIVHDAEQEFGLNEDIVSDEEIGMFGYRAGQRVLDGDYGGGDGTVGYAVEYLGGAGAWNDRAALQHLLGGFVAEGTEFALDGNFHHWQGSWSAWGSASVVRSQKLLIAEVAENVRAEIAEKTSGEIFFED